MPIDSSLLHRPIAEASPLLLGPVVRRVTRGSAAVFVATKEPFAVTLRVFDDVGSGRIELPSGRASADTVALGANLHVCVVEASSLVLTPGRLYGYDIELSSGGEHHNLASLGLLSTFVPLGYVSGELPGFVLPEHLDDLKLVHCSCRKSHGCDHASLVDPDALPIVDKLIERERLNPAGRPQQLFLSGDQVYSDDVPAALLAALSSAGRELLDWEVPERFPGRRPGESFADDDVSLEPGERSTFLDDQAVKTRPPDADPMTWSDYAANHLLFFSEWCAMYLFAWSPELWLTRDAIDPDDRATHPDRYFYYLPPAAPMLPGLLGAAEHSADTTTPALAYAQSLPFVRRALANVATYMVFDDHDVTDDWFLDAFVEEQLRGKGEIETPGGRRLMRNALSAYAVFQHWGNAPEAFEPGTPGGRLLNLLDASGGTPLLGQSGHEEEADILLDVGEEALGPARADERMRWDWELIFDEHRLMALDTRTWRGHPSGPREVDVDELLRAAADRVEMVGDWGPLGLVALGAAWVDAADRLPGGAADLEEFVRAGAALIDDVASFALAVRDGTDWEALGDAVIRSAGALLDSALTTRAVDDEAWARAALGAALAGVQAAAGPQGDDPAADAFAVAAALNAAALRLRADLADWLVAATSAGLPPAVLAFRASMGALANTLVAAAGVSRGAALSVALAARHAAALAHAWLPLAADEAGTLWGEVGDDVAVALRQAADACEPIEADLDNLALVLKLSLDPVWKLLVGKGNERLNAALISEEALAFQVAERVADVASRRELTLVISPAPVFGHWLAELGQRAAILQTQLSTGAGDEQYDNEPWSGNLPAWAAFLSALAPLESVVLLSGDVHYAFSSVNDYLPPGGAPARFVQLTSSAAKNADGVTRKLAQFDELKDDVPGLIQLQFDFTELLPSASQMTQELSDIVPSREDLLAAAGQMAAVASEALTDFTDAAAEWWESDLDWDEVGEGVERQAADVVERVRLQGVQLSEAVMRSTAEGWGEWLLGDRLLSLPLMQDQALLLLQSLGIDPAQLVEAETIVLRDRRSEARAGDSPGLTTRLEHELDRNVLLRLDRTTVGHNNVGLIRTQNTPLGRFLVHDLHWFPLDEPVSAEWFEAGAQTDSSLPGAAFRDDWIITRHVAGLTLGQEPDGGVLNIGEPGAVYDVPPEEPEPPDDEAVNYGGYDLQRRDTDVPAVWGGRPRTEPGDVMPGPGEPGFVDQLRDDLSAVGFGPLHRQDPLPANFDGWLETAVRELQAYARMPFLATEGAADPADAHPSYATRLVQVENPLRYSGPVSGVLNEETREVLARWVAEGLRCPVVVEARPADEDALIAAVHEGAGNLRDLVVATAIKDLPQAEPSTHQNVWARLQVQEPSSFFFAWDLSGQFPTADGRSPGDPVPLAAYTVREWKGLWTPAPAAALPEAEITPDLLLGASGAERVDPREEPSWATFRVIRAVSEAEALGYVDGIQAYDRALLSAGPYHWTLGLLRQQGPSRLDRGELSAFLSFYKDRYPEEFERFLGVFGIAPLEAWDPAVHFAPLHRKYFGFVALQREDGTFADPRTGVSSGPGRLPQPSEEDAQLGESLRHAHWYFRLASVARQGAGFRTAMGTQARERIRALLETDWDAGVTRLDPDDAASRPLTLGDVFTSEASVALLLRWIVYTPPTVLGVTDAEADYGARPPAVAAIDTSWLRRAAPAGHPSKWGDTQEEALSDWLAAQRTSSGGPSGLPEVRSWPNWHLDYQSQYTLDLDLVCEQAPEIDPIANVEVAPGDTAVVVARVVDREIPGADLAIRVESSDESLLAAGTVTVSQLSEQRFQIALPAEDATGRVTVTVVADDRRLETSRRFYLYLRTPTGSVPGEEPADQYVRPERAKLSTRRDTFRMRTGDLGTPPYPLAEPRPSWDAG